MLRVYNYMTLGLAITGAAALGTYMLRCHRSGCTTPGRCARQFLFASSFKWVVILAPLAFVFFLASASTG